MGLEIEPIFCVFFLLNEILKDGSKNIANLCVLINELF